MIKRRAIYLGSVVHGLWMVGLALLLLTNGCATGDEVLLVRLASTFHHAAADETVDERFGERFLFVDVAHDLQLVQKTDADGFPLGNQAIIDRTKLAELFRILGRSNDVHRFVLCDVFLEAPSPHDDALEQAVAGVSRVLFPYHTDAEGRPLRPVLDVPIALAQYDLHGGAFVKFTLRKGDSLETVPLKMYDALHDGPNMLAFNRLNTFIPDMEIPAEAIGEPLPLGELLMLPEEILVRDYLAGRIVVIGDFSSPADHHQTVIGPMPGPLILANTYLSLRADNNRVKLRLLLFLWFAFSVISLWNATYTPALRHAAPEVTLPWRSRWRENRLGRLMAVIMGEQGKKLWLRGLRNVLFLALTSAIAYFAFGVHLHVLALAVYLSMANALLYDHFAPTPSWWHKASPSAAAAGVKDDPAADGVAALPSSTEAASLPHTEPEAASRRDDEASGTADVPEARPTAPPTCAAVGPGAEGCDRSSHRSTHRRD